MTTPHLDRITLDDRGQGHPFLLLHGGAGPQTMLGFAALLAATRPARTLTPTIPGFDGTPAIDGVEQVADLAATWLDLLEDRDLRDVTVVGNSVGGWAATQMLLDPRAEARISSAVLLDPVGILVPDEPITDLTAVAPAQIADYSFHQPDRFRIDPDALPPGRREQMAANAGALARYAGDPYMHDPALRAQLGRISVPVHIVWGAADRVVTPRYGACYADAITGAALTILATAGHLPQLEAPEPTRDLVWTFADHHARHRPR